MTQRVVVATPLFPAALALFDGLDYDVVFSERGPAEHEHLLRLIADADALICSLTSTIDASVFDAAGPTLQVVSNVAVGFDNIDLAEARRRGVTVCNTPGVLDGATADLTMLLLLAVCRRLPDALDLLRSRRWDGFDVSGVLGRDLSGMTLGLVGFGRIGHKVGDRARAFEMEVRHHARHQTGEPGYLADLDELLATSDAVSLHVPLTDETRNLLDARRLDLMAQGAIVVNTARGAVVDEEALAVALELGRLGGAGLDVFTDEPHVNPRLLGAPNVVLTPHIGSATVTTRTAMCEMAVRAVVEVLAGRPYPHVVVPGNPQQGQD
jgi:lactate dehydrogenase-like 2-hydroxyacid dehydrogenase